MVSLLNTTNKSDNKFIALHRYYIFLSGSKREFFLSLDIIKGISISSEIEHNANSLEIFMEVFRKQSVFYVFLKVVIEGFRSLKLNDPKINLLLNNSKNIRLLNRFRNATCHYQELYSSPKLIELYLEGKEVIEWIYNLCNEFDRYFLSEIRKINTKSNELK